MLSRRFTLQADCFSKVMGGGECPMSGDTMSEERANDKHQTAVKSHRCCSGDLPRQQGGNRAICDVMLVAAQLVEASTRPACGAETIKPQTTRVKTCDEKMSWFGRRSVVENFEAAAGDHGGHIAATEAQSSVCGENGV